MAKDELTPAERQHRRQFESRGYKTSRDPAHRGQGDFHVTPPFGGTPRFVEFKDLETRNPAKIARKIDEKNGKIAKQLKDPRLAPSQRLSINGVRAGHSEQAMVKGVQEFLSHPRRQAQPSVLKSVDVWGLDAKGQPKHRHIGSAELARRRPVATTGLGATATRATPAVVKKPLASTPQRPAPSKPVVVKTPPKPPPASARPAPKPPTPPQPAPRKPPGGPQR